MKYIFNIYNVLYILLEQTLAINTNWYLYNYLTINRVSSHTFLSSIKSCCKVSASPHSHTLTISHTNSNTSIIDRQKKNRSRGRQGPTTCPFLFEHSTNFIG